MNKEGASFFWSILEKQKKEKTKPMSNLRLAVRIILCILVLATLGCHESSKLDGAHPQIAFKEAELEGLKDFSQQMGYGVLSSIEAKDLFSYLSGYYPGGHKFPSIFFDPRSKTFTVTYSKFQKSYREDEIDKALDSYRTVLLDAGYEIHGVSKDNKNYVWVDGKKMVYVDLAELFPDPEKTKSRFTEEQYNFIYGKLDGWRAFSYLSGMDGKTPRDFPLMVGLGYKESARIRVLGRDIAEEFTFDEVETAFKHYREYLEKRFKSKSLNETQYFRHPYFSSWSSRN